MKAVPELKIRRGARLPHWTREGAFYALTFRLADSLPKTVLDAWEFERQDVVRTARQLGRALTSLEEARLDTLFSQKVGRYLDEGRGNCWLRQDRIARLVASALEFFEGARYRLLAWCIMPNHVHVVLEPLPGNALPEILHSWKSYTAKQINKLLEKRGQFWEVEYYDHLIRDERDFKAQIDYVLANPLRAEMKDWKWMAAARASRP